jgi:hypothetical protein
MSTGTCLPVDNGEIRFNSCDIGEADVNPLQNFWISGLRDPSIWPKLLHPIFRWNLYLLAQNVEEYSTFTVHNDLFPSTLICSEFQILFADICGVLVQNIVLKEAWSSFLIVSVQYSFLATKTSFRTFVDFRVVA